MQNGKIIRNGCCLGTGLRTPRKQRRIKLRDLSAAASGSIRGLRDAAYRVSSAANGADALGIVGRDLPDLALPDKRMAACAASNLAGACASACLFSSCPLKQFVRFQSVNFCAFAKSINLRGFTA